MQLWRSQISNVIRGICDILGRKFSHILVTFTRDHISSDQFGIGSTMVQIHSVYKGSARNWNGTVPYGITFISGPIYCQIANPIRTESTRSRVNTRLTRANFVLVPNGSGPVQTLPLYPSLWSEHICPTQ